MFKAFSGAKATKDGSDTKARSITKGREPSTKVNPLLICLGMNTEAQRHREDDAIQTLSTRSSLLLCASASLCSFFARSFRD
jgi:hypothetical protein